MRYQAPYPFQLDPSRVQAKKEDTLMCALLHHNTHTPHSIRKAVFLSPLSTEEI